jgi:acetolactate synthase-1/2/3 large subunit
MTRSGADVLIEALAAEGVTTVFGLPGTTIMDVLDALARQSVITFVSVRHEQVAGFAADGFARAHGDVGVCLVSRGPGAANLATALQNAYDESIPVLALVGQVPAPIAQRRAFEEMDVVSAFRPFTKWVVEVGETGRIPELAQRAIRIAVTGRPGPVVVSLPLDVLQGPTDVRVQRRARILPPVPHPDLVKEAAELLLSAERPVLILGGGAAASGCDSYLALAAGTGAAVATTWLRKGAFPNDHPQFIGSLGYGAFGSTEEAVHDADVVVAIGCRFSEFTSKRWTLLGDRTALIHVDIDPEELGRLYQPAVAIWADGEAAARAVTREILSAGQRQVGPATERACRRYADESRLVPEAPSAPGAVASADLVAALRGLMERDDVVLVQDVHSFGPWISRYVKVTRPGSYFGAAGGAMAWGFPAAIGVSCAWPGKRVVAISGDGSFWMVAQDLETCVREGIPVVNIVVNNYAFGNTRDRQRFAHDGRYLGVFLTNPDLGLFARLVGGHGERVTVGSDLPGAIARALDSGLPAVVDVVQDKMEGLPPGLTPITSR